MVQTPSLDALAREGIRFTHNCVTTSICGVSRANLLTGQYMSRHGCRAFSAFETPWSKTYPGKLRSAGYWVGHVGKWHNGRFPKGRYDFGRSYYGKHWYDMEDGRRLHVTQRNEEDSLEFLKTRPIGQPFCLTVAFFATHAEDKNPKQFLPQPQSMSLYQDRDVPIPVNATQESWERLPEFFTDANEGRVRWAWRFDTPEKYQQMMKNYYRLATEVDTTCGKLLEELKHQGVLDQTLVLFTTDNGYYHAEHGLGDKWYPHQESIRVPLIVRDPRMPSKRAGRTDEAFTLSIDLAPTILAAAGIDAPERMQGRDVAALYTAEQPPAWRQDFFYEHPTFRNADFIPASEALVEKDWKYILWPVQGVEQLFCLSTDALEERDLVSEPRHAQRLARMRERFAELKAAAE
ncbi:Arylsulfatase [Planctomycetes bacterium MalM25]|nr:Arylsulfatase [Planctomycetes bacterium MalM25]